MFVTPTPRFGAFSYAFHQAVQGTSSGIASIEGNPYQETLGRCFTDLSLEEARNRVIVLNGRLAQKERPDKERRAHKAEITFAELFDLYLERHAKPKKETWEEDRQKFDLYCGRLAKRKLSDIDRPAIAELHSNLTREHPVTANRVLALISSIFGRAIEWGLWQRENPCKGIRRNRENSRDRFLQRDELPRFFQAVVEEKNETMRDFFRLSLLTGARRANVLAMKWDQINFDRAEWRIPDTKNGTPHTLPLSPEAIEILSIRRRGHRKAYVFPGKGKQGHLVEPKKGWQRIFDRDELTQLEHRIKAEGGTFEREENEALQKALARARSEAARLGIDTCGTRISNLRVHDLRRTMGSWQAMNGASLSIIGCSLNQKSVSTTAIYARLSLDPVRESVNRANSAMLDAGGITLDKSKAN